MRQQRRDVLAAGIALVALTLGIGAAVIGRIDPGIDLQVDGDHLVVARITPYSPATNDQVQVGMIVTELNGTQVYRLPAYVYPDTPTEDPNVPQEPTGVEPAEPVGALTPDEMAQLTTLADAPIQYMNAIAPNDLAAGQPDAYPIRTFWYYPSWRETVLPLLFGAALLFAGWKLVRDGTFGTSLQPLAAPIAVAVAMPFLTRPLAATWDPTAVVAAGLLTTVAMLPLADGLWERIRGTSERRSIGLAIAFCEILAIVVTFAIVQQPPSWTTELVRWALVAAIPLLPGLAAAGPLDFDALRSPSASSGRLLESAEFAVAGATPMVAITSLQTPLYSLLLIWIGFVVVAGRFTVRPLARVASRAQLQRDLVVAATEAERARLAADIHDDALQELTLLVRRLEASGDEEGAELGRTVSDRLRAIFGDLRLPDPR